MNHSLTTRFALRVIYAIAIFGLLAAFVVVFLYVSTFGTNRLPDHILWAQFGDYIGGTLGAAFAFLALMALLITFHVQYGELRNSTHALSQQSKSLELQNFENRLFNMLSLHHTIINGMDLRRKGNVTVQGRDCMNVFYCRLKKKLQKVEQVESSSYPEKVISGYYAFYAKNGHELSHYFRHLYRILKFIHNSAISDKKDYSGILRAQLSNSELALLFYNGLTHHGEKLKPLAETYALFENMEPSVLNKQKRDVDLYNIQAFGDQADRVLGKLPRQ